MYSALGKNVSSMLGVIPVPRPHRIVVLDFDVEKAWHGSVSVGNWSDNF